MEIGLALLTALISSVYIFKIENNNSDHDLSNAILAYLYAIMSILKFMSAHA